MVDRNRRKVHLNIPRTILDIVCPTTTRMNIKVYFSNLIYNNLL